MDIIQTDRLRFREFEEHDIDSLFFIACIQYAFESLKLENLTATVEPENFQSICVLRKIGMKFTGEINYAGQRVHGYSISKSS